MKNTILALLVTSAFSVSSAFGAAITDVTYEGSFADAAYGPIGGNDTAGAINGLIAGDDFALLDKTDAASSEFLGVTFTLTAGSGLWQLSWATTGSPGLPVSLDFVFVTKAANDWSAYLFSDVDFTSSPTSGDGTYTITWLNNGGNVPALSHASLYARTGGTVTEEPFPVPEPGTLVLFGTALLGLGFAKKRKSKA